MYIGTKGFVDYLYKDGGFVLNTGTFILCVTDKKFKYKLLEDNERIKWWWFNTNI